MLLSEIFDQLTYGELTQLELAGANEEGILVENHKRIIPHVNLALTELHKRFLIREEEVTVRCWDHIETYPLEMKYAETSNSSEPYKWIHDTIFEPFQDNVLRIEKVFNEDGQELFVNETDPYAIQTVMNRGSRRSVSVHTPNFRTVQVPFAVKENALVVEYRANHPRILVPELNPETTEIALPSYLLEPFLLYIAARAYSGRANATSQDSISFTAKFEASCNKVVELNLVNRSNTVNQKSEVNGWV